MSVASNFTSHIIALLCCVCASLFPRLCLCGPCIQGVEFWAVNTDAQALANHSATNKVQIGSELTRGLGCGGAPELGAQAAIESHDELRQMLQVCVFVCVVSVYALACVLILAPNLLCRHSF
eukprot:1138355-Pelagomonas_calceolata.AAC.6